MVGTLEEMKDDLATVTDYTKNGECSQCGKCCAQPSSVITWRS